MVSGRSFKDPEAKSDWWTHGEIELGGRGFTNNPRVDGATAADVPNTGVINGQPANLNPYTSVSTGQKSLAKFYEYGIQAPGAFGGGHFATGSKDGLYQLDFWANNVGANFGGFSDQSYLLSASKVGEHYLTIQLDQTPHIYSTSALTPYSISSTEPAALSGAGIKASGGARFLTLPANFPGLSTVVPTAAIPQTVPAGWANLSPNLLNPMYLGIQRDTISLAYRWTPTDNWDINTDYTHRDRTGTQAGGIASLWGGGNQPNQIPIPIDDTTQNYGVNGERIGNTPWGKYTFKLGYTGSTYTDNISAIFVQNPFVPTTGGLVNNCLLPNTTTAGCVSAQLSTPPSNQANGVSATLGADLPANTRYTSTVSFTNMTQNAPFMTDDR